MKLSWSLKSESAKILLPSLISDSLAEIKNQNNLESFITYSEVDRDTSLFPQELLVKFFQFLIQMEKIQ